MSRWSRKVRNNPDAGRSPVHVENGRTLRCDACWDKPAVVHVHPDERRRAERLPGCPVCGFRPRVEVVDDEAAREVVPPGTFGEVA